MNIYKQWENFFSLNVINARKYQVVLFMTIIRDSSASICVCVFLLGSDINLKNIFSPLWFTLIFLSLCQWLLCIHKNKCVYFPNCKMKVLDRIFYSSTILWFLILRELWIASVDYIIQKNIVAYEMGSFSSILPSIQQDRKSIGEKAKPRIFQSKKGDEIHEIHAVSTRD